MRKQIVILAALFAMTGTALAVECPPNAKSCKIVTITPEEEQSLVGQNAIFDHAVWANRAGLEGAVNGWKQKLQQAPAGEVKAATPPPKDKK